MPLFAKLDFANIDHPWLWLALALLGAGILAYTYLSIFQRSQRKLTWGLLALRGAGVAALFLALAQPSWTREEERVDPGRLAVIVDDSISMSLPGSVDKSRYALAREAANKLREELATVNSGPELRVDLFDLQGTPLINGFPAEPRVERTDLVRAVSETAARLRSRAVAGIVLISDGMDNTGRSSVQELGDGPPVNCVGFRQDPSTAQLDLLVRHVTAPERVMVDNEVKVDVLIGKLAGPATEATLAIKRGGSEFASQAVPLAEGNVEQVVSLRITPREAGRFVFTASIAAPSGERLLANNAQHFPIEVEASPIRVLYLEGFLREEYKFLKTRLEDDPDLSLVTVVRRANPAGGESDSSGGNLLSAERLADFDVVILGDFEGAYFTPAEYESLVQWIDGGAIDANDAPAEGTAANRSHALLVLGGYQSFGENGFRGTPLAAALPVEFSPTAPYQGEDPFVMELTPAGQSHPIFEVTGDSVRDLQLWSSLPPLLGSPLVAGAKPGADVLARNPSFPIDGIPAVVIATQRFGAGRTMVVAADTTWRWSRLARMAGKNDTLYPRFWSQTIRWLAGREKQTQRPPLAVSTDRPDYEVRKPVHIRAVRQSPAGEADAAAEVTVEIADESGRSRTIEMHARSSEPNVFNGTFHTESGGRYEVAAALSSGGKVTANQTTEFLVHGSD
ncbi:MAG: glutamine amidotransferase [Pirellulales bacterium]